MSPFKIVAINPTGPYSGQRKSHGGELSWLFKPVLKIDPLRSLWWKGPLRNFQFYYMRKRSYSLDKIPVPKNEFDEGREEHPSKRFFQVHWPDSAIKPRICKVLEKIFWGDSIIKWVILYQKHRTSGCHVVGSRDNRVSKFELAKNVGLSFSKLGHDRKFWSRNLKSA